MQKVELTRPARLDVSGVDGMNDKAPRQNACRTYPERSLGHRENAGIPEVRDASRTCVGERRPRQAEDPAAHADPLYLVRSFPIASLLRGRPLHPRSRETPRSMDGRQLRGERA